jgi:DNA-binding HxlR family transcriptional regulator
MCNIALKSKNKNPLKSLKQKVEEEISGRPKAIFTIKDKSYDCPIELALNSIGGKWKILLLWNLMTSKRRYSEFKYLMPGINFKMLTQQLKELENDGLIGKKTENKKPPLKVEYFLTKEGKKLKPAIMKLREWGLNYIEK